MDHTATAVHTRRLPDYRRERAAERAVAPLNPPVLTFLHIFGQLPGAAERERVVLDGDLDPFMEAWLRWQRAVASN